MQQHLSLALAFFIRLARDFFSMNVAFFLCLGMVVPAMSLLEPEATCIIVAPDCLRLQY